MRARNIKPGFFMCPELAELGFAERVLFIGLWCYADREGRFEWKPKKIKAEIFPYDDVNITALLCNLMSLHFITCFDTTGYVEKFKKHQNPHPHEAQSALPEKPLINQCHDMSCNATDTPCNDIECNADSLIPDSLIPDIRIEDAIVPAKPSRPARKKLLSDDEWMQEIKMNPAYEGIDIDRLKGKLNAWCMTKQLKPTRARLVNWLNREEKPMVSVSPQSTVYEKPEWMRGVR